MAPPHRRRRRRRDNPPPLPPMPPGRRRGDDEPERSSSPPPPYIPPGRRRRDDEPERFSPPRMPRQRDRRDQRYNWFPYLLPDGQTILAYKDRQGVLLTDHGGSTRPVADVCREVEILSDLSHDPAPPDADDSDSKRPDKDQQTPTPNPRPSPAQYTDEDQQTATPIPGTSQAQYAEEDQPAPQQTPTPNPGPSPAQYVEDVLNKAFAVHKLEMAQRRKKLLDTAKLEELSITNALSPSLPQSPLCEDMDQAVNHDTIKASSTSSHNSPPVYSLKPTGLHFKYYVRVGTGGSFHTYPTLTGPFHSLEDAQDAINSHHADQRKMMCMEGLSQMEIGIRRALYWPSGLRRNSAEAFAFMKDHTPEVELVRALLDKYNEDNNLSGDPVYELIEVVRCESIHERIGSSKRLYYHFNLVIRTKGADDSHGPINNLFFAEIARMNGESEEFVLTFFRMLKPDDNGKCFECDVDMKHPSDVEYKRGRVKIPRPGGMEPDEAFRAYVEELGAVYDEAKLKAQEARVRNEFKELYEPGFARVQEKYVVPAMRQAV